MTQIKQEIAADKGWKGWALFPCKLAIICGMWAMKTIIPIKGTDRANDLVDFLFIHKILPLCIKIA